MSYANHIILIKKSGCHIIMQTFQNVSQIYSHRKCMRHAFDMKFHYSIRKIVKLKSTCHRLYRSKPRSLKRCQKQELMGLHVSIVNAEN